METMKGGRKEFWKLDGKKFLQQATKITFSVFAPWEMGKSSNLDY